MKGDLSGEATQEMPVDGIKEGLVAYGQSGEFIDNFGYSSSGCRFLGGPGMFASWFLHQVDVMQAATGRVQPSVEIGIMWRRLRAWRICLTGRGGGYRGGKRRSGCGDNSRNEGKRWNSANLPPSRRQKGAEAGSDAPRRPPSMVGLTPKKQARSVEEVPGF